jgi:Iron-containing redox enzyme
METAAPVQTFGLEEEETIQRALGSFNEWRLLAMLPDEMTPARSRQARRMQHVEARFVEAERAKVRALAGECPPEPELFLAWFESLEQSGPGQHDVLFDWLANVASREEMRWFLSQEIAGEAGFDDLVAMTQIKMPARVKLELARNYWDEMGQGHGSGMHGPMLSRLAEELGIANAERGNVVWESIALGNLLIALAADRRYAFHAIGALGAIELTAPGRALKVNAGLKRLGVGGEARRYFALHSTLDVKHSVGWNAEVIRPLVTANPTVARAIAEGALMRLSAGERCFRRYRQELGVTRA